MSLFLLQMTAGDEIIFSIKVILNVLMFLLCITACYTDLSKGRVPNWLTMPFLLAGFALQYIAGGWNDSNILSLSESVGGLLIGGGFMILLYFIGGLGGGDVKLFAAIGALKGQAFTIQAVLNACLIGGTLALFQVIFRWITYNPYADQTKITTPTPKVQVIPEPENLTIEQKKEMARKKREEEEKKKTEPASTSAEPASMNESVKPLHPEDPEAEVIAKSPEIPSATTSQAESSSEKKAGDLLHEEEEKKQGIPFGFAISLGVIITFILNPNL